MFRTKKGWVPNRGGVVRLAVVAVLALTVSACLGACGDSGASEEELAKAEKRGRHYRMEQERKRKIEKQLKELRQEQKQQTEQPPNPPPSSGVTPAPESSRTSCGGSLSVGPDTTCAFAENVRYEYESEIGSGAGTVYAYSPANNELYEMYCTGSPHECSGAINATVFFP